MKNIILPLLFLSFSVMTAPAQSGVSFLQFAPDAKSAAMAGSGTSLRGGPFATYWNPAGLAKGKNQSAGLSQQVWAAGVRTFSGAARLQSGKYAGLGVLVTATTAGDIEARETPGDPLGVFSAQFGNLNVAYGRAFGERFRVGLGAKVLNQRLDTFSERGWALDAGFQAEMAEGDLEIGATLRHFGKLGDGTDALPTTIQGGASFFPFKILGNEDGRRLLDTQLTIEAQHIFPNDLTHFQFGLSTQALEVLSLRAGYRTNDELRSWSLGAGFIMGKVQLDYAYLPFPAGYNDGHVFTLGYTW
ncbi:MAG: PorV/PorQ family protein [Bacteroidetes Order II. Incertae sedis bacterium]|nr:PorV/PorQ family protein [Bacteroidetes Order II. bacterium]